MRADTEFAAEAGVEAEAGIAAAECADWQKAEVL